MTLAAGTTLAGYRIDGVAGVGGMGVVYRATHLALDTHYGLKVIAPELASDASFRERFQRECRIAASIRHPNVIPIHHAGEDDGQLFLVMDLIEGTDLRELLARDGPLDLERAARIFGQVAGALDAAHARGLVHRDIKPANILVEAGSDHPYLTDFGLSKSTSSGGGGLTRTGQWLGTADYVAPEQILGSGTDARTDVYALGCLLYHMLTGNVPFPKEGDPAKLWAHMNDEPPSLRAARPDVSPALEAVIRRAMAKEPDDRYPSAGDLAAAVQGSVSGRRATSPERSVATGDAAWDGGDATVHAPRGAGLGAGPGAGVPPPPASPPTAVPPAPPITPQPAQVPPAAYGPAAYQPAAGAGAGAHQGYGGWPQEPHAPQRPAERPRRRVLPIVAGVVGAVVIVGALVALLAAGVFTGGGDAQDDVRGRIAEFASARTAGQVCDQYTDSFVKSLGGRDRCLSQNSSRRPFNLDVSSVEVNGDNAVASAKDARSGDPWDLDLVRQGDEWAIDGTDAPRAEMRSKMQAYAAAVGSEETCDLLSDALIASQGGRDDCERLNRGKTAYDPYRIEEIEVTGRTGKVRAVDPDPSGGPVEFAFVKQGPAWFIDNAEYLRGSAERDWKAWARAKGGKQTCFYFSDGYLDRNYSGSRSRCERELKDVGAFRFKVQFVRISGYTRARLRALETGDTYDYSLVRVGRGWKIDRIKKR